MPNAMTEPSTVEYTPFEVPDVEEHTSDAEEEPRTPLAWFEIETTTFGEFKQSRSSTCLSSSAKENN